MGTRFAFGLAVFAVSVAIWPGLDQPGATPRAALLLVAGPLLFAVACRRGGRGLPLGLGLTLALPAAVGLGHLVTADGTLAMALARDLAWFASLGLIASAAALIDDTVDGGIEWGAGLALVVCGVVGLAQAHLAFAWIPQSFAPAATFVNRNVAAQALVVLVPLALPMLARRRGPSSRWFGALAVGGGIALLLATRSRGAWLAAAIGWSVPALVMLPRVVAHGSRRGDRRWRALAPWAVAVTLIVGSLIAPLHTATGTLATPGRTVELMTRPLTGSGATRLAIWRNSLAMAAERPLTGRGAGTFAADYPPFNHAAVPTPGFGVERQPRHVHLDALELAIEFGVPSAIAVMLLALFALSRGVVAGHGAGPGSDGDRRLARSAALGALLVHGLVSFPLHSSASACLFWLILGRACRELRGPRIPIPARSAVALVMIAVAAVGGLTAVRELTAQRAVASALAESRSGRCGDAAALATGAARRAPWSRHVVRLASTVALRCGPDSLGALEDALRLNPSQPNLLLAVGAGRLEAGRLDDAAAAFGDAIEILPSLSRGWVGLATAHALRGDASAAARACEGAIAAAPDETEIERFCVDGGLLPARRP